MADPGCGGGVAVFLGTLRAGKLSIHEMCRKHCFIFLSKNLRKKKELFFQPAGQKQRGHYLASGRYTHAWLCTTMTAIGNLKVWHIMVLILLKLIAFVKFSCT